MNIEDHIERYGLTPNEKDLPFIRNLLAEETKKASPWNHEDGDEELMRLCCIQLFSKGNLSDTLLIWQAKCANMDAGCMIDVQFLCGAGLEETKTYLQGINQDNARDALAYLLECEETGDFEGFSVENWMEFYRNYFTGDEELDDVDMN